MAYDIDTTSRSGDRRLRQVASICERFGRRVQFSLFECRLDLAGLESLRNELLDVIDREVDAIDIYRFDRPISAVRTSLGRLSALTASASWIVSPAAPDRR